MRTHLLISLAATALIAGAGTGSAQHKDTGSPPAAKQAAPTQTQDASGHDVQSGNPETADKPSQTRPGDATNGARETGGSAPRPPGRDDAGSRERK